MFIGKGKNMKGSKTKSLWENTEYRERMRLVHIGQVAWNKGLKIQTNTGKTHFKVGHIPLSPFRKGHMINWKGDKVGYIGLHIWVRKQLGRASKCINGHIASRYFWANISGEYKRDLSDWHELCQSCNQTDGIKKHERFIL